MITNYRKYQGRKRSCAWSRGRERRRNFVLSQLQNLLQRQPRNFRDQYNIKTFFPSDILQPLLFLLIRQNVLLAHAYFFEQAGVGEAVEFFFVNNQMVDD